MYLGESCGFSHSHASLQVAIHELSKALPEDQRPLPLGCVEINDNSSFWLPNSGATAGSTAAEGCCEAVRLACKKLVRLATTWFQYPCRERADVGCTGPVTFLRGSRHGVGGPAQGLQALTIYSFSYAGPGVLQALIVSFPSYSKH